ncbi:MAG: 30S ribosome-binding factor RbfA [Gemmatirosa sp.]
MPYDNRRPDRVAEAIREEVAGFLADGVKDPRVRGLVTVTGVDITRDLRHAKIFVSIMGSEAERAETLEGLAAVAAHLRGRVGRALRLRVAPEIAFRSDPSVAHAARIESLLEEVRRQRDGGVEGEAPEAAADAGADAPSDDASDVSSDVSSDAPASDARG